MSLRKKGQYRYASEDSDILTEIARYSRLNAYEATRFTSISCGCGGTNFTLETDEEAGSARRTCANCGECRFVGDSADYAAEATFGTHVCACDSSRLSIGLGLALYPDSHDVRWLYIGCRCPSCNIVGVYADWKCEAGHADLFLSRS
jgi:hypothetical protein